jgi:CO/xanthine dehydrogenase Mo-binding subunit
VTGATRYTADLVVPGMLWVAFLGSLVPHARIRSVDASRARTMPGVQAVLTGEDVRGLRFGRRLLDQPVLAWDRVRFVGDRLAAVAAETAEQAEAAVQVIDVDLEPLPAVFEPGPALAPDAPVLHPEAAEYRYLGGTRPPVAHPNVQGTAGLRRGDADLEPLFAGAANSLEHRYRTPPQHHGAIEPDATLAWIDELDRAHVVTTNKDPFGLRNHLAAALDIPADRVVIHSGFIGGDFGGKGYSVDAYACILLARATGRPVRAVARHTDGIATYSVRHPAEIRLRSAVDSDGRLVAHEGEVLMAGGAYAAAKPSPSLTPAAAVTTLAAYRVPNVRVDVTTVYTNTVPGGALRAPGEFQAVFAGESHLDEIARMLGYDPLEFRLRNAVGPGETGATGAHFRDARGVETLETVRREMAWDRPRPRDHGLGVAMGARHFGGGRMGLRLRVHHDGRLELLTGTPEQGGGTWTALRRVFAACASIDERRVSVAHLATDEAPFSASVGGSRTTHLVSRAAEQLAGELRGWLDERLPRAIPAAPPGTRLHDDRLVGPPDGEVLATLDEVVAALVPATEPVTLEVLIDSKDGTRDDGGYSFGACAVEVHVDRQTGAVRLLDALLVVDTGTVINPIAHRGQLDGGFAFGLGAALMEGLTLDRGVITNASLADMKLPAAVDVPAPRIVLLPPRPGPGAFGAKGAGEMVNIVVAPAVANAVADAVGARVRELPITAERVLDALRPGGG